MKKIYLLIILSLISFAQLRSQSWNFSDGNYNHLGAVSSPLTINGLTIYASDTHGVNFENHSIGIYSRRLKLNGGGQFADAETPTARVLAFQVDGNTSIKIATMSNGSARTLNVAAGNNTNIIRTIEAPEGAINTETFEYVGGATTIFVFSASGGINLYEISTGDDGGSEPVTPIIVDASTLNISYQEPPAGLRTFYIAPDGNNSNPGTMAEPFASLTRAATIAQPGDVFIMRGGVYHHASRITIGTARNGTAANPVTVIAYPGEVPTLDFAAQAEQAGNDGLRIDASYWHVIGLHLRMAGGNGFRIHGSYNRLEQCVAYRNHLTGIHLETPAAHNLIKNCDSFHNFNFRGRVGNMSDGFAAKYDIGPGNHFYGCRSWENSDDGFDFWRATETIRVEKCWVFGNGDRAVFEEIFKDDAEKLAIVLAEFDGGGNGFKMGGDYQPGPHLVTRCLAFDNKGKGYDHNNNTGAMTFLHNTAYRNDRNFVFPNNPATGQSVFRNNLSHDSRVLAQTPSNALVQRNSWQHGTVNNTMFESLNTMLAKSPRERDGALPNIPLLKPVAGTFIIDGGMDIGEPFFGLAPDMGAYEYNPNPGTTINQIKQIGVSIYPNPVTSGIIHINLEGTIGTTIIRVISMNGAVVKESANYGQNQITMPVNINPGVYIIQIINGNSNAVERIVVQ